MELKIKNLPEAHLPPNKNSRRDVAGLQGFPLSEKFMPFKRAPGPGPIITILRYLDVEHSPRYQPGNGVTHCDGYAEDFCRLAGVYLPKVFWTPGAIRRIESGESVKVDYGKTVMELNANSIHVWLHEYGQYYGWESTSPTNQQEAVNSGKVGIITGLNVQPHKQGHITVVIPEDMKNKAARECGEVRVPLQSESGAKPRAAFCQAWWKMPIFKEHTFWVNTWQS